MILSYQAVSKITGLSRSTIYRRWQSATDFPAPILDERGRVVGWNPVTIECWVKARMEERSR
ncbi:helix-turn-helix transcriptional regulator [Vibrio alfacsensis]|uniref:helix-turn-helix transcriptional regulator n=1 Tax=Vibrio alfacsensis TaxID=1074311 RepID=UPI0040686B2E